MQWGWIHRVPIVLLLAACTAQNTQKEMQVAVNDTKTVLSTIAGEFQERTEKRQSSANSRAMREAACRYDFARDKLLEAYFQAALEDDQDQAYRSLYQIYAQLLCVSEQDFRDFYLAFGDTALNRDIVTPERVSVEVDQILAPVAFMFFEQSGRAIDDEYREWFEQHQAQFLRALRNPEARLAQLGLMASWDQHLAKMLPEQSQLVVESMALSSWGLSNCKARDAVLVDDKLLCPETCTFIADELEEATPEQRAAFRAALPELADLCAQLKDALADHSGLRQDVFQCVREFTPSTHNGLACLTTRLKARRSPDALFERIRDVEMEVRNPRNCFFSQGGDDEELTPEEGERLLEIDEEARRIIDEIEARNDVLDDLREPREDGESVVHSIFYALGDHYYQISIEGEIADLERELRELSEQRDRILRRSGRCSPDSPNCADDCGIRNELVDATTQCVFPEDGASVGAPGTPHPWVSHPSPIGPDVAPEAVAALQQCLTTAIETHSPQQCQLVYCRPDAEIAEDADPGEREKCPCLSVVEERELSNARFCENVWRPGSEGGGQSPSCSMGEDDPPLGGERGGFPPPDPEVFGIVNIPMRGTR